jgi:hypothetical protein
MVIQWRSDAATGWWSFGTLLLLDIFIGFGIGGVYFAVTPATDARIAVSVPALTSATLLGFVAAVMTLLGYRAVDWRKVAPRWGVRLADAVRDANRPRVILVIECVGWLGRVEMFVNGQYFHITEKLSTGPLAAVFAALAGLPTIAFFILVASRWASGRPIGRLWMLSLLELAWYLPSGTRAPVISLMLGLVVLRIRCGYRTPRLGVAIGCVLSILVLFPAMAAYRGADATYADDMGSAAAVALRQTLDDKAVGDVFRTGLQVTLSRFSDILSAAIVFRDDANHAQRTSASLGDYVVTAPVPRALAPDKPNPGSFGNEFGRAYGMIAQNDLETSIAVSAPLHAYMEGGWPFLVMFCFLSVMGYSALERVLTHERGPVAEGVYASVCFSVATSIGTIWPLGFVGLCKSLTVSLGVLALASLVTTRFTDASIAEPTVGRPPHVRHRESVGA